jgi:sugar phosphate isomerase/epimerase
MSMLYTRRDVGKIALAAGAATRLMAAAKPNSMFGGVQIGCIVPYSLRGVQGTAEAVLKACLDCGLSGIELMSGPADSFAGAPAQAGRGGFPGGGMPGGGMPGGAPGAARAGAPAAAQGGAPGAAGAAGAQGRGPGGGRAPLTPEQQAAQAKAQAELRQWRETVSMDKFKAFRKMYNDAGVKIYAYKLEPNLTMSDGEYAYIWNVAETLGANHVTMELPTDDKLLARVAEYAEKRKLRIAFHTHGAGGAAGFDRALNASKYTALNFDVGHFFGINGTSPVPLVEKYASRIASLHLKDRAAPPPATAETAAAGPGRGGANMPWGQGGTPLKEVLLLMKQKKYKFPASVELEYSVPQGSDSVTEITKCVQYCKNILA